MSEMIHYIVKYSQKSDYLSPKSLGMHDFRKLKIWQSSIALCKELYLLSDSFPKHELMGGITSQIRKSSVSVPSNIAEACGKSSEKDFVRIMEIALGSIYELETQLIICKEIGYMNANDKFSSILNNIHEIQKGLSSLIIFYKKKVKQ